MSMTDVTSSNAQRTVAKWSTIGAVGISLIVFMLGKPDVALGIVFSCSLMVLNFWTLSLIPRIYERLRNPYCGKVAAFTYYYMRFWLVVLILFLTIPKAGYDFALGCFVGFIIPKIALGAIVITNTGEDWWLKHKAPAETNLGPENRKLTPLEKELMQTDPFKFSIEDFEWKNYLKSR
ncbi:MAG: hypothetical protein CVV03_06790 [Firmicutes bacterium HGW-Firmicutes-8]|nr:MAG: hypothetical protein CVV03_06790 [Firmicutes bacterium HGW-Firmicutes-8]